MDILEILASGMSVIKGPPGGGKTVLAAWAASRFPKATWFTCYETEDRLKKYLASVGIQPPAYIFDMASAGDHSALLQFIIDKVLSIKPDFLVLDGVNTVLKEDERALAHMLFYHGISRDTPVVLIKEGIDITPIDHIADNIIEVHHKTSKSGDSYRYVKFVKSRGRHISNYVLPYVITSMGPAIVPPRREPYELSTELIPTKIVELDNALGGGILKGSHVALVGPEGGLASKIAISIAAKLATRGNKVSYYYHKTYFTPLKYAERLDIAGLSEVHWRYHPAVDHKNLEWYYITAKYITQRGFDIFIEDQYEQVAATVDPEVLVEGLRLFDVALEKPFTKFYVFNLPQIWRKTSPIFTTAMDYIFYLTPDRVKIYTPHLGRPIVFSINWEKTMGGTLIGK